MGTLYENIMALCKERGIKGATLANETGISKGLLTDLKKGRRTGVSAVTAQKIATYFGVSVGYLLGEETEKAPALTAKDERDIELDEFTYAMHNEAKHLPKEKQQVLLAMAKFMRQQNEKEG